MKTSGFTLLELLITVSIVASIALFCVVIYKEPITKSHQAQAKVLLLTLAFELEQYFDQHNTYQGATIELLKSPIDNNQYKISLIIRDDTHYQIAAVPLQQDLDECGIFYVDQDGNKTITGPGMVNHCW